MPNLPFIGNCRAFGGSIPLFRLLEHEELCDLVPANGRAASTGFAGTLLSSFPAGDTCDYSVQCIYDDFAVKPTDLPQAWWWEPRLPDLPLFFLSRFPVRHATAMVEEQVRAMSDSGDLVPVYVVSNFGTNYVKGSRNFIPRKVELHVAYTEYATTSGGAAVYGSTPRSAAAKLVSDDVISAVNGQTVVDLARVTARTNVTYPSFASGVVFRKRLVKAELRVSEWEELLTPSPCASTTSPSLDLACEQNRRQFTFHVVFAPLDLYESVNGFLVNQVSYVLLALVPLVLLLGGSAAFWFICASFFGTRVSKLNSGRAVGAARATANSLRAGLNLGRYYSRIVAPIYVSTAGHVIAAAPMLGLTYLLLDFNLGGVVTAELPPTLTQMTTLRTAGVSLCLDVWRRGETVASEDDCLAAKDVFQIQAGRYGIALLVVGLLGLFTGARVVVPDLAGDEYAKRLAEMKQKNARARAGRPATGAELKDEQRAADELYEAVHQMKRERSAFDPVKWRLSHVVFMSIFFCFPLLMLQELARIPVVLGSSGVLACFLVLLKLLKMWAARALPTMLGDELLAAPALFALTLNELTTCLSAPSFVTFMVLSFFVVLGDVADATFGDAARAYLLGSDEIGFSIAHGLKRRMHGEKNAGSVTDEIKRNQVVSKEQQLTYVQKLVTMQLAAAYFPLQCVVQAAVEQHLKYDIHWQHIMYGFSLALASGVAGAFALECRDRLHGSHVLHYLDKTVLFGITETRELAKEGTSGAGQCKEYVSSLFYMGHSGCRKTSIDYRFRELDRLAFTLRYTFSTALVGFSLPLLVYGIQLLLKLSNSIDQVWWVATAIVEYVFYQIACALLGAMGASFRWRGETMSAAKAPATPLPTGALTRKIAGFMDKRHAEQLGADAAADAGVSVGSSDRQADILRSPLGVQVPH